MVKISDFAQDNEEFAEDYYNVVKGNCELSLPVRWMPWESLFMVRKPANDCRNDKTHMI